nr:hypothetical protein JVH1_1687 [Rhodococcus sp. JVH1]
MRYTVTVSGAGADVLSPLPHPATLNATPAMTEPAKIIFFTCASNQTNCVRGIGRVNDR